MRFLATVACDKVIIDKAGAHSLIEVMSGADIVITPPPGLATAELPPNTLSPKQWSIFSMWEPSANEFGKEFEQVYVLHWPNGDKLLDAKVKFKTDDRVHYTSYSILGFPVGQQGKVKISTWIEKDGSRITDAFDYFITIRHIAQDTYPEGTPYSLSVASVPIKP
jgi:hypothetical protein